MVDVCGYSEEDIRIMKDDKKTEQDMWPNEVNIVRISIARAFVRAFRVENILL